MTQLDPVAEWLSLAELGASPSAAVCADGLAWLRSDDERAPRELERWLGRCWLWCSRPLPTDRRVAVMTSRVPRLIDPHGSWMLGLREALRRVRRETAVLATSAGCAGHELAWRGAVRQASPVVCLHCCDPNVASPRTWARRWRASLERPAANGVADVWVLPCSPAHSTGAPAGQAVLEAIPPRDRAAVALADEVMVLSLRAGGNLHALLRQRLTAGLGRVAMIDLPELQSRRARDELVQLGASLWSVPSVEDDTAGLNDFAGPFAAPIVPAPAAADWAYLTHCTRACVGPWPRQSRDDYLDGLLDASSDADHSALATLSRIIAQRRIVASNRTVRGGFNVVSFTAVPVNDLARLRVFRTHRGRWDFEPYGLCVRRDWLARRGARPVRYGSDADWQAASAADRPFFQLIATSAAAARGGAIDWRVEAEWRHVGDIDLSDLPAGDGLVFAPNQAEAVRLSRISRWPIFVAPVGS
jgi:hypothetical protein